MSREGRCTFVLRASLDGSGRGAGDFAASPPGEHIQHHEYMGASLSRHLFREMYAVRHKPLRYMIIIDHSYYPLTGIAVNHILWSDHQANAGQTIQQLAQHQR